MLYGSCSTQDLLLRRKIEEQQQAADLQQAIELQGRRFMGLHLLDLKNRSLPAMSSSPAITVDARSSGGSQDGSPPDDQRRSPTGDHELVRQAAVNATDKEESGGEASPNVDSDFQESVEHNLPDSPFASPTKASILADPFTMAAMGEDDPSASSPTLSCPPLFRTPVTLQWQRALEPTCNLSSRFSSGHGAVGM